MISKIMAILAIWLFIAQNFAHGQENQGLRGKVLNTDKTPLALVTVALYRTDDSTLVSTTFSEPDGLFQFSRLKAGNYFIRLAAMGYAGLKSDSVRVMAGVPWLQLPAFTLNAAVKSLKEVNVSGKKPFVVRKPDRVVVNVDALMANAGTSALEVLERSPGVQVDQNGLISLKGKQGVTVYIDGKPSYLSGADLENYLKSLPSSSLEEIELMSNPPAGYDAAGNGGIINIKTRKGVLKGFNGGLNLSVNQGHRPRSSNSLNFNVRGSKINYFASLSYSYTNSFTDLDIHRTYKNEDGSAKSYFNQNSFFDRHGHAYQAKAGADYMPSEHTSWGVVFTGMERKSFQVNHNTSNLLNPSGLTDSVIKAINEDRLKYRNGSVNFNYRHQFDQKGHLITADADYLTYHHQTDQHYFNAAYYPDGIRKSADLLNGELPSRIHIYAVKTDYTLPIQDGWKMDAGLKAGYTKTYNIADYTATVNDITFPDYDKSNHFVYQENINAAYVNFKREGKLWSLQAGLRVENTVSDGHQLGNLIKPDSAFKRSYTGLFPTIYLHYKLDTAAIHQFGLNYGRRIDRPYYQDLNPFLSPLDKFTYYSGNPFLKPAYTNSLELSHTYKNKYTTTISYSSAEDEVSETVEIVNGIYYSRPANIGRKIVKSISFNGDFNLAACLNISLYTEVTCIKTKSEFYTGSLNSSGTYVYIGPVARLRLGSGWDGELSGNYRSRLTDAQFVLRPVWQANVAAQKKLSSAATLKLSVNDLFYTKITKGIINNLAQTEANWVNRGDSRNAVLSLSYRFGKAFSNPGAHQGAGADAEKNRVKD